MLQAIHNVLYVLLVYSYCVMPLSARTRQQANEALLKQGLHSVLVQYPRTIFDSKLNWKSASHISPELKARNPRGYEDLARAQDLEDVMLYENWFYGVSNGIIIEVVTDQLYYISRLTMSLI